MWRHIGCRCNPPQGFKNAHPISLIGCGIYCAVVNELLCGGSGPKDIQRGIAQAKAAYFGMPECKPYLKEYHRVDADTLQTLSRSEISGSGYVVHTLEAALWCLLHTNSYRSCLLETVNLGEDADTVGPWLVVWQGFGMAWPIFRRNGFL